VLAEPAITKALKKEFASGNDPHGRKWKKLATGKPSHLTLSGKLRRGTRAAPMPGGRKGLRIILGAKYGAFHQTGTRHMPARRILPDKGMPASWRLALERAHREVFQQITARA
jgi:phage gpG-like protein